MPLTENQKSVLSTLERADRPLSAYEILDELRGPTFKAPTQVYRALRRLVDRSDVHRLDTLNAYVSCTHPAEHQDARPAFAICTECDRTVEFTVDGVARGLDRWASEHSFSIEHSTLELRGRCADCGV